MSKKSDNKMNPTSIVPSKTSLSPASEKVIVDRLKSYGVPLLKGLNNEALLLLVNHLFSLSPTSTVECLESYGSDFVDVIRYEPKVRSVLSKKILALPKAPLQKCLDLYKGKFVELLKEERENQISFIDFLFSSTDEQSESSIETLGSSSESNEQPGA